ncbi:MAG: hypothetical protein ACK5MY_05645 [Jhaorihella sp.]
MGGNQGRAGHAVQRRRAWLEGQLEPVVNALNYYLGPTGIPQRLNALGQALEYTDAGDLMVAAEASRNLMNDPSLENALRYATAGAALAVPFVGAKMMRDVGDGAEYMASRAERLYNFPSNSEVGDALGRSGSGGFDLEGRPLVARHVVGRTEDSPIDRSLNKKVLDEIATRYAGGPIKAVPASALPGKAIGAVDVTRRGSLENPRVLNSLARDQFNNAARHETGHIIDHVVGEIPVSGLSRELRPLYSYEVEGRDRARHFMEPKHIGYVKKGDADREYMAEAIRQYIASPDAMKKRAPKTAARIRKFVNEHPTLSEIIQFNSVAGGGMLLSSESAKEEIEAFLKDRGY